MSLILERVGTSLGLVRRKSLKVSEVESSTEKSLFGINFLPQGATSFPPFTRNESRVDILP